MYCAVLCCVHNSEHTTTHREHTHHNTTQHNTTQHNTTQHNTTHSASLMHTHTHEHTHQHTRAHTRHAVGTAQHRPVCCSACCMTGRCHCCRQLRRSSSRGCSRQHSRSKDGGRGTGGCCAQSGHVDDRAGPPEERMEDTSAAISAD